MKAEASLVGYMLISSPVVGSRAERHITLLDAPDERTMTMKLATYGYLEQMNLLVHLLNLKQLSGTDYAVSMVSSSCHW
jgi:hypothetical protein